MSNRMTVLIVEDGDEYRDNLERFVAGPRYLQAHTGSDALAILERDPIDLIYLDMRFDRIVREALLGDHAAAAKDHNGDGGRAWRFLQNHQGLFILDALVRAGFGELPVILAYDFSREARRFLHLQTQHPRLAWVSDAVTPDDIRTLMADLVGRD